MTNLEKEPPVILIPRFFVTKNFILLSSRTQLTLLTTLAFATGYLSNSLYAGLWGAVLGFLAFRFILFCYGTFEASQVRRMEGYIRDHLGPKLIEGIKAEVPFLAKNARIESTADLMDFAEPDMVLIFEQEFDSLEARIERLLVEQQEKVVFHFPALPDYGYSPHADVMVDSPEEAIKTVGMFRRLAGVSRGHSCNSMLQRASDAVEIIATAVQKHAPGLAMAYTRMQLEYEKFMALRAINLESVTDVFLINARSGPSMDLHSLYTMILGNPFLSRERCPHLHSFFESPDTALCMFHQVIPHYTSRIPSWMPAPWEGK